MAVNKVSSRNARAIKLATLCSSSTTRMRIVPRQSHPPTRRQKLYLSLHSKVRRRREIRRQSGAKPSRPPAPEPTNAHPRHSPSTNSCEALRRSGLPGRLPHVTSVLLESVWFCRQVESPTLLAFRRQVSSHQWGCEGIPNYGCV